MYVARFFWKVWKMWLKSELSDRGPETFSSAFVLGLKWKCCIGVHVIGSKSASQTVSSVFFSKNRKQTTSLFGLFVILLCVNNGQQRLLRVYLRTTAVGSVDLLVCLFSLSPCSHRPYWTAENLLKKRPSCGEKACVNLCEISIPGH